MVDSFILALLRQVCLSKLWPFYEAPNFLESKEKGIH